jgi:hypothetical protein
LEQHVGNPRGRIAVWLDEGEAIDLAVMYGSDGAYDELMQAVERAYPHERTDESVEAA